MSEKLTISSKLTTREKLGLHLIIMLLKLVKPYEWSHELNAAIKPIEDLINGDANE